MFRVFLGVLTAVPVFLYVASYVVTVRISFGVARAALLQRGGVFYERGLAFESGMPLAYALRWGGRGLYNMDGSVTWGAPSSGVFSSSYRLPLLPPALPLAITFTAAWHGQVVRLRRSLSEGRRNQERVSRSKARSVAITYSVLVVVLFVWGYTPIHFACEAAGLYVLNTIPAALFYYIWLGAVATLHGRMAYYWLRWRVLDLTCCRHCGYNLTGNRSGRCPECGQNLPADV